MQKNNNNNLIKKIRPRKSNQKMKNKIENPTNDFIFWNEK